MFINTIEFPPIPPQDDQTFRRWFTWSNSMYGKFEGFVSRRLMKRTKGGEARYVSIVEHANEKTFMTMHTSAERQEVFGQLKPLLGGEGLKVQFFEVVEE